MGGSSGGGGGNTTTTTKVQLPKYAEPYSRQGMERAWDLSREEYKDYPYQTVSSMTPEHEAALQNMTYRALTGSPTMNLAQSNLQDTLRGSYLYPGSDPYLQETYNQAAGDMVRNWQNATLPQLNAAASRAGAFGGSQHSLLLGEAQRGLGENLGKMATDLYGTNYDKERQRQIQAMFFAPQMAQTDYQDMQALLGVGDIRRQYSQDVLNDLYRRYTQQQQWPYTQQQEFARLFPALLGSQYTSSSSSSNPYQSNPTSQILGGALSGIGTGLMASMIPGVGPFMAAGLGALPFLGSIFG